MLLYRNGICVVGRRLASPQAASELATLIDTEANRVGLYAAERLEGRRPRPHRVPLP
jgi:hypothetical protein